MSIEALIRAHTEALLANTEAVKLLTLSLAGRTPTSTKVEVKVDNVDPAKVKKASDKQEKAAEKSSTDEAQEAIDKEQDDKAEAVPYETVRALVLKLAPTQREAIKALNTKHGIANLKVLLDKEDDFSSVNDQVKLEAVYADLQALEA
jgi:sortase (surface protein transpeptidase)